MGDSTVLLLLLIFCSPLQALLFGLLEWIVYGSE